MPAWALGISILISAQPEQLAFTHQWSVFVLIAPLLYAGVKSTLTKELPDTAASGPCTLAEILNKPEATQDDPKSESIKVNTFSFTSV